MSSQPPSPPTPPGPPDRSRRRLDPSDIWPPGTLSAYYVIQWRFADNIMNLDPDIRMGRVKPLLAVSYLMSKLFRNKEDAERFVMERAVWFAKIDEVIQSTANMILPDMLGYRSAVGNILDHLQGMHENNYGSECRTWFANFIVRPGIPLVHMRESSITYFRRPIYTPSGRQLIPLSADPVDGIRIRFNHVRAEYIKELIDADLAQRVFDASRLLRAVSRRNWDDLANFFSRETNPHMAPVSLLIERMDGFVPNNHVPQNYPGLNIFMFTPARYYLVGFSLVGPALWEKVPTGNVFNGLGIIHPLHIDVNQMATIQKYVMDWLPHPPRFGPGAFAFMMIGVEDFLLQRLAPNRRESLLTPPNIQSRLEVDVIHSNGAMQNQSFPLTSGTTVDYLSPILYGPRMSEWFRFADLIFNRAVWDFYTEDEVIVEDLAINQITIYLIGPVLKSRAMRGGRIDGNNVFWERLLLQADKFKGHRGQFVIFPSFDRLKNEAIHGCAQRALECKCRRSTIDAPVVCKCEYSGDTRALELPELRSLAIDKGDLWLIFVIWIGKQASDGRCKKTIELYHLGKNYFSNPEGKVLYVSMPEWSTATAHCALWIPKPYEGKCREDYFAVFLGKSRYNAVNAKIAGLQSSICPICGDLFNDRDVWGHYLRHSGKEVCPYCGLDYTTEAELTIHMNFHCKKLARGSTITLSDDQVEFKGEKDIGGWICVYADLESAILEEDEKGDRIHENILVGWADNVKNMVKVSRNISDFLNDLVKLPATDIIVYFHNGEGYDFHFIIRDLCDCRKGFVRDFSIVGDSGQKVRFFSVKYRNKNLHFRDSFAFVGVSLEKWVESSKGSGCIFPTFQTMFKGVKADILLRKNPFPYNAIKGGEDLDLPIEKLIEWCNVENAEELFCFKYEKSELLEFSSWIREHKDEAEWKTVLDYYRDYLICDVAQLKDVMEFFAQNVEKEFGLNIHAFYGTPSLTWGAWLKQNKYPLDPIVSPRHYDVINSTIRGGQTGVFTRKYIAEVEGGAMFDLDCNSLYPTVMLKFTFPCHDWKEEPLPDIERLLPFIRGLHESGRSAFIELDMEVLEKEEFMDYVPVASKRCVKGVYDYYAMNFYETEAASAMYFNGLTQVVGLHEHYCCHSRNLEWYITHGVVEIKGLHFILSGKDEPVFEEYVSQNLEKRKEYAYDPIKKMLYKLLNNSLYGKTYEDETQRADYYLEPKEKVKVDDHNLVRRIINEMGDWLLYEGNKTQFSVNKPVYLGACITEFSKLWMYQFFYDKIRLHYPDSRVYYTDTDALTIYFPTMVASLLDIAEEMNTEEEQIIDTSNFAKVPEDSRHTAHNNEAGLFKSETGDHRIVRFIGLRAKTYIMICEDGSIKMSVKGCPMKEKEKLKWEDFDRTLLSKGEGYEIEFDAVRSKYHLVRSVRLKKIVLSADDRKRYILPDLIHTLPLFSKEHVKALQL